MHINQTLQAFARKVCTNLQNLHYSKNSANSLIASMQFTVNDNVPVEVSVVYEAEEVVMKTMPIFERHEHLNLEDEIPLFETMPEEDAFFDSKDPNELEQSQIYTLVYKSLLSMLHLQE